MKVKVSRIFDIENLFPNPYFQLILETVKQVYRSISKFKLQNVGISIKHNSCYCTKSCHMLHQSDGQMANYSHSITALLLPTYTSMW